MDETESKISQFNLTLEPGFMKVYSHMCLGVDPNTSTQHSLDLKPYV